MQFGFMKGRRFLSRRDDVGQGTVEAAFTIPVVLLCVMLLVQPGILLYDRTVMNAAAAEGCRLLATKTGVAGDMTASSEAFIRHRLAAIPPVDCFHVHASGCTWDIELSGDESSAEVSVSISTEVRPLPLFDAGAALLGLTNGRGNIELSTTVSMPTQPGWVASSPLGQAPGAWIGGWVS